MSQGYKFYIKNESVGKSIIGIIEKLGKIDQTYPNNLPSNCGVFFRRINSRCYIGWFDMGSIIDNNDRDYPTCSTIDIFLERAKDFLNQPINLTITLKHGTAILRIDQDETDFIELPKKLSIGDIENLQRFYEAHKPK